eukprot:NODE_178_length_14069_cov_0.746815.p4 type:complete len:341 gc:universal NODE_178_length_14069_cov_0.746815:1455-433(-)
MFKLLVSNPKDLHVTIKHRENSMRFTIKNGCSILEICHKIAPVQPTRMVFLEQDKIFKSQIQGKSKLTNVVEKYSDFIEKWTAFDLESIYECQHLIKDLDELDQKFLMDQNDLGAVQFAQWINNYSKFLKMKKNEFDQVLESINTSEEELIITSKEFLRPQEWELKMDRLVAMGFLRETSEVSLTLNKGDVELAINDLLENQDKYTYKSLKKSTSKNSLSMEEKALDKLTSFFSNKKVENDLPTSPGRPHREENITVNMGRQLRMPYNFKLIVGNLKTIFTNPVERIFLKGIRSQTINNIMDNLIHAVVLMVPKRQIKKYLQGYTLNLERLSVYNYGKFY